MLELSVLVLSIRSNSSRPSPEEARLSEPFQGGAHGLNTFSESVRDYPRPKLGAGVFNAQCMILCWTDVPKDSGDAKVSGCRVVGGS